MALKPSYGSDGIPKSELLASQNWPQHSKVKLGHILLISPCNYKNALVTLLGIKEGLFYEKGLKIFKKCIRRIEKALRELYGF
jgi:hypothetical protein